MFSSYTASQEKYLYCYIKVNKQLAMMINTEISDYIWFRTGPEKIFRKTIIICNVNNYSVRYHDRNEIKTLHLWNYSETNIRFYRCLQKVFMMKDVERIPHSLKQALFGIKKQMEGSFCFGKLN